MCVFTRCIAGFKAWVAFYWHFGVTYSFFLDGARQSSYHLVFYENYMRCIFSLHTTINPTILVAGKSLCQTLLTIAFLTHCQKPKKKCISSLNTKKGQLCGWKRWWQSSPDTTWAQASLNVNQKFMTTRISIQILQCLKRIKKKSNY